MLVVPSAGERSGKASAATDGAAHRESNATRLGVTRVAVQRIEGYLAEEYDEVHIVYNEFRSVMTQEITFMQLLPVSPTTADNQDVEPREYIYEPSQAELLAELLPKHIEVQIFKTLLESVAGEHGARMTAMDSASKNASEMIGKLTLIYNRARQAAITNELMEIISGAESQKG